MFLVKLSGGLGNQVSNYAFSRLLKYYFPNSLVKLRISDEALSEHNGFELLKAFKLKNNTIIFASSKDVFITTKRIPYSNLIIKHSFLRKITNCLNHIPKIIFKFKAYDPLQYEKFSSNSKLITSKFVNIDVEKSYMFWGLWLNYHYPEIIDELKKELIFNITSDDRNTIVVKHINYSQSVAIHIRKGDYLSERYSDSHNIVDEKYYIKAVSLIKQKLDNPTFFVFSDDSDFAKIFSEKNLDNYVLINWNNRDESYKDMYLISKCKHYILSNSSFSYWGCLLGRDKDSIVVCPNKHTTDIPMWNVPGFILLPT